MFDLSKTGVISMNRGDNWRLPLFINSGTKLEPIRYRLNDYSSIHFSLMSPGQSFEDALVKKIYTNKDENEEGDILIDFSSKDTAFFLPGKYYYQVKIQIVKEDGSQEINTIIPMTEFYIMD